MVGTPPEDDVGHKVPINAETGQVNRAGIVKSPSESVSGGLVYSVTIIGNVEQCRTEAEISDSEGAVLAVVYETSDGWHTDVLVEQHHATTDFHTAVENAKESLSHYVNRREEDPPENATWVAFSLWLMMKDDGTTIGMNMKSGPKSR